VEDMVPGERGSQPPMLKPVSRARVDYGVIGSRWPGGNTLASDGSGPGSTHRIPPL